MGNNASGLKTVQHSFRTLYLFEPSLSNSKNILIFTIDINLHFNHFKLTLKK